jgi:hypothetical protein
MMHSFTTFVALLTLLLAGASVVNAGTEKTISPTPVPAKPEPTRRMLLQLPPLWYLIDTFDCVQGDNIIIELLAKKYHNIKDWTMSAAKKQYSLIYNFTYFICRYQ